jgi:hypothetical protein
MAKPRYPANAVNIIARVVHPSAYHPYEKWSGEIWDARLAARKEANRIIKEDPERARKILANAKAKELEAKAAELRKKTG